MKGSMMWRLAYLVCALAGCLAGYGIVQLTGTEKLNQENYTKDNTLVREVEDSVFFAAEKETLSKTEDKGSITVTIVPVFTPEPEKNVLLTDTPGKKEENAGNNNVLETNNTAAGQEQLPRENPEPETPIGQALITTVPDALPSLGSQWADAMPEKIPVLVPGITPVPDTMGGKNSSQQEAMKEVITYPAKIFGQVPVINRADAYVSYFEFAYDLVTILEPVVKERGQSMNSLMAKFVIRALLYGVDVETLDINAPIPRRLAALCLWLAGQLLKENGCNTSAKSAQGYVNDIRGCSSAEKKAVAYLYEQGMIAGYQVMGQSFYPDSGLQTEHGMAWLAWIKQNWN